MGHATKDEHQFVKDEVGYWPGVSVRFERRRKHVFARLHYRGKERFVVLSGTGGDKNGHRRAVMFVRKELRTLGAERIDGKYGGGSTDVWRS